MELLLVLLALYLFAVLVVLPVWVIVKFGDQQRLLDTLYAEIEKLRAEVQGLRATSASRSTEATPAGPEPAPARPAGVTPSTAAATAVSPPPAVVAAVPPATVPAPPAAEDDGPPVMAPATTAATPPRPVAAPPVYTPPPPPPGWMDSINWEQFMGAKLFAWLGGLALFLGVAFFVKYSFEHDLIPPAVRVALGFVFGAGLVVGGLRIPRERYAVTAQSLIGAGIVSLYAVTFACRSIYHFEFFGAVPTFLMMALITTTAFVLAVRLGAQVVAILGILGGFLTPVLINTGVDNPGGLFGYLALLDAGLIAVVLGTGWRYLVPLGAAGTALMMVGWADKFFVAAKGPVAMTICLGFAGLYFAAAEIARRREASGPEFSWTAVAMPFVGLGFGLYFLNFDALAARAALYFGYVLVLDGLLLALAWYDDSKPRLHLAAGMAVFLLLSVWTTAHVTNELLPWALAGYLAFAALHTVFPLVLERHRPAATPTWWSQLFPPLALVLMLLPIFRLDTVSFLLWPAILLVDVIAIALAVLSASLAAVAAVLLLTLLATGLCLFRVPVAAGLDLSLLVIIGGFAVFFFAACLWLVRRLGDRLPAADRRLSALFGDARAQLPAFASLLPFLLLIMACARLPVPDPSAVFGLGLLLVALTLGLARVLVIAWLPACALAGMAALELAWHSRHFDATRAGGPLAWYVGFYALFAAYPFVFRRQFARLTGPWAVAALAGVAQFWMVYRAIKLGWPASAGYLGLVPALFAVAPLASLVAVLRAASPDNPKRLNQLAWFGGVALAFITLIFPIQFERQWLTVAWALEGAALLWLFHRVPHPGLRATGAVLLLVAFGRLALNPAVLGYHVRGDTGILNWYLYAYGLVLAALFTGARLTAPPRHQVLGVNIPPVGNTLGAILAFILLNIEIADYFTPPGARALAFQFSGNFARDMTYTIGWALFALGLLAAGIWRHARAARYAAIALLSLALLKLFFHDLARLEALYRVGTLMGVAVIAFLASFAYQRFLPGNEKSPPPAA
ncbi:MAG TPA: DUF2339 domain-containing protein [Lacunisphaera sp.]|nr:DUF2339 domain-containing protein [Lacunisphaera sp.]